MRLVFDKSVPGRRGVKLPAQDVPSSSRIPDQLRRAEPPELPELGELDVVRHFTELSRKNFGVDNGFYPLGSCTMKYNPKATERIARLGGFADLHPLLPQLPGGDMLVQGALEVLFEVAHRLCTICGMSAFTTQPLAGAHGELTAAMIMAAYHKDRGGRKTTILIPDSAHGTNPASAAIAGSQYNPSRSARPVSSHEPLGPLEVISWTSRAVRCSPERPVPSRSWPAAREVRATGALVARPSPATWPGRWTAPPPSPFSGRTSSRSR